MSSIWTWKKSKRNVTSSLETEFWKLSYPRREAEGCQDRSQARESTDTLTPWSPYDTLFSLQGGLVHSMILMNLWPKSSKRYHINTRVLVILIFWLKETISYSFRAHLYLGIKLITFLQWITYFIPSFYRKSVTLFTYLTVGGEAEEMHMTKYSKPWWKNRWCN